LASGVGVDAPGSHDVLLIKKQGKVAMLEEEIVTSTFFLAEISIHFSVR
jgi:hypothetical protein